MGKPTICIGENKGTDQLCSQVAVLLLLAEYYRDDRCQLCWCQQRTTETGIRSVCVSRVLQRQVSGLFVLAEYFRDIYQFCWCKQSDTNSGISCVGVSRVLQRQVSVLLVLAE